MKRKLPQHIYDLIVAFFHGDIDVLPIIGDAMEMEGIGPQQDWSWMRQEEALLWRSEIRRIFELLLGMDCERFMQRIGLSENKAFDARHRLAMPDKKTRKT